MIPSLAGPMELLLFASVTVPTLLSLAWPIGPIRRWVTALAPWAAAPALLLAGLHLTGSAPGPVVEWAGFSMGLRLALDEVGGAFLLLTAGLWFVAGAFARIHHASDEGRDRFFGFFSLTMAGNLGLVVAGDLATFYLAFAVMTFAAYGLVAHRHDAAAQRAGRVYIVLALVGEAALLTGVLTLGAAANGALGFGADLAGGWAALGMDLPDTFSVSALLGSGPVVATLIFIGFGVKAGIVPLHLWLPLAHPVAPTAASALLSGAMIKAGLLGWLRVLPEDATLPGLGTVALVLGVVSAFYGVILGIAQDDPKTVLAYSSVSQMGYMSMGTGLSLLAPELTPLALSAVVFFALHHGVAKGALFLAVGVAGGLPGEGTPGASRWRGAVLVGAGLPALALAGAPFTSGARAKEVLKEALAALGGGWYATLDPLLLAAAVGTTLLMARYLFTLDRAIVGKRKGGRAPWGLAVPWAGLVLVGAIAPAWLGIAFPVPEGVEVPSLFYDLFPTAWPLLVGAVVSVWVLRGGLLPASIRSLRIPPGDLLIPAESVIRRFSVPSHETPDRWLRHLSELPGRGQRVVVRWVDRLADRDLLLVRGLSLGSLLALLVVVLALAMAF